MTIKKINIHNLRIIDSQSILLDPRMNIFFGDNGSGKTSILEAINFALNGRSFRTSKTKNIISYGKEAATVFISCLSDNQGIKFNIGVTKRTNDFEINLNGQSIKTFSQIARIIPLQVIDPSSFNLLDSPPDLRRRFIDWSVFHVEHDFMEHWKRYKNSLKQRNTLLRRGKIKSAELSVWNQALATHGEFIDQSRKKQLTELQPILFTYLEKFNFTDVSSIELRYLQGWDKSESLYDSLNRHSPGDIDQGYTRFGPHRADLKFNIDGKPASEHLSRGQQKSFHICLKLAQSDLVLSKINKPSVFLLDDITAELDEGNVLLVYDCLSRINAQVFVTTLDKLKQSKLNHLHSKNMFHVKHGVITQIS